MRLYEIAQQHKALQKLADSDDGALAETIADTFESIEGDFEAKAESLIAVVNNMDAAHIDVQIKRLQAMKKSIVSTKERMIEYLRFNMSESGITSIKCPLFSIVLAKGRDIVEITDEGLVPSDYKKIEVVSVLVKADILRALKCGVEIPGARLVKSKTSLRIK